MGMGSFTIDMRRAGPTTLFHSFDLLPRRFPLTSMEVSMEVGGSRFTSMEISMEVGGSMFPWKLVEVSMEIRGQVSTVGGSGSFH